MSDSSEKFNISIDGIECEANAGELIITACDNAGVHIPRFCYHPRMKPVGMCRMCLVEVSGPRGMSLAPSCYLQVAPGMEIVTDSEKVKKAQDGVLEFLLINHPLDCPVCDKGGECPLQDQTLAYGPGESRFVESKRHWAKPIPLSDLILLDRERCIQCGRCIRFAEEIAGDPMIDFMSRGETIEVNIFEENKFTSYYSGNTVQICPVGALTATPYRFASRPWDLEQVESTCMSCANGCRMVVQSSQDKLIRNLGIDSDPVNQSWLCDKGRFGFTANQSDLRVTVPLVSNEEVSWKSAIDFVADAIKQAVDSTGPESVAIIGGSRLTNEDAYCWSKFARSVIGTDSVDAQLGDGLAPELVLGLPKATIDQACKAPLVVLVGPDIREEAPILFLRLKDAATNGQTKLIEVTPNATSLSKYATQSLFHRPGEQHVVISALVSPQELKPPTQGAPIQPVAGVDVDDITLARKLIQENKDAVFIVGRPSMADSEEILTESVSQVVSNMSEAKFLTLLRRANTHGALDSGLAPGCLPGRTTLDLGKEHFTKIWGKVPATKGSSCTEILQKASRSELKVLILLGADPIKDFPSKKLALSAINSDTKIVSITAHMNDSAKLSDVVLPATMFGEKAGTTTNFEGRVSSLGKKVTAPGQSWDDWAIAVTLAMRLGGDLGFNSLEDISEEMEKYVPLYRNLKPHIWESSAQKDGIVLPITGESVKPRWIDPIATPGISSLTHHRVALRDSNDNTLELDTGKTSEFQVLRFEPHQGDLKIPTLDAYSLRLMAPRRLYDAGTHDGPASATEELPSILNLNHYDLDRIGASTGDRVKVVSSTGEHVSKVALDDSIAKGTALIWFNLKANGDEIGASDLIGVGELVTDIRLEAI